ncbi:MAG: chorismate synthase, partial [Desulfobacterales bacterium]
MTFGESHGNGVGAVLDGCPSKINLSEADIQ